MLLATHKVLRHCARQNIFHSFFPKGSKKLSRNMVIDSSEIGKINMNIKMILKLFVSVGLNSLSF